MSLLRNQRGFTFTEIIIAVSIMALGFLAMAQMQYLSLRQKQKAEQGTIATNIIQFIADRDMEEVKRAHLLNSVAYMEAQSQKANLEAHLQHCSSANENRMCDSCPCNPLAMITPSPFVDLSTTCAVIDVNDFDPKNVEFETQKSDCTGSSEDSLIIVKRVMSQTDNGIPAITTLNVTYGVKTKKQFEESGYTSVTLNDTLATQNISFTAHRDDWSQYMQGWNNVIVPHVP